MPNTVQLLRGLETNRSGQTPAAGEPLYTTDDRKIFIGDGSTAGGELAGTPHKVISFVIDSPAVASKLLMHCTFPFTIVEINAATDTSTADFNIEERTAPNTAGTNAMTADLQATSTGVATGTFSNADFALDNWLAIDISAVGTATELMVTIHIRVTA